jgi:hypothetical protein
MIYKLNRDVTPKECTWLENTCVKGTIVYEYQGYTYGCVTPGGMAVTLVENETPFFELPVDALAVLNESTGAPR